MANDAHIAQLKKGVDAWNAWRDENPDIIPDLSSTNFSGADLSWVDLSKADLSVADLSGAELEGATLSGDLTYADLRGANLRKADLRGAHLDNATLDNADLSGAFLDEAILRETSLRRAILKGADLQGALLLKTDLSDANLSGCRIYGVSAWGLELEGAKQENLIITSEDNPAITVDNIEVAQFIYLMLHNQKLRDVIDTITSKAVLILGRFTDERKAVLDALREELRKDYVPILFDFEKPRTRDTEETITLLARMARFIIADVTDAKAVLQELHAIVPELPSVPVQSIILATQEEPGMFDHYRNVTHFLKPVHRYTDQEQLLADLGDKVIRPAELKVRELRG